jgi:hypothetical protein
MTTDQLMQLLPIFAVAADALMGLPFPRSADFLELVACSSRTSRPLVFAQD